MLRHLKRGLKFNLITRGTVLLEVLNRAPGSYITGMYKTMSTRARYWNI